MAGKIHNCAESSGITACLWIQVCIGHSGVYIEDTMGMSKVGYLLVISHIWCS